GGVDRRNLQRGGVYRTEAGFNVWCGGHTGSSWDRGIGEVAPAACPDGRGDVIRVTRDQTMTGPTNEGREPWRGSLIDPAYWREHERREARSIGRLVIGMVLIFVLTGLAMAEWETIWVWLGRS